MTKLLAPVLSLVLLLSAAAADAAIVYLKDGSRLQGTIVGATARDVQLYTPDGTLRISTDRIKSIDYEGSAPPANAPAPAPEAPPVYQPSRVPVHSRFAAGEREEETNVGRNELSLDLGIAAPLSDVDFTSMGGGSASNGDVGVALGAQWAHFISEKLGLGADLEWLDRSFTDSPNLIPASNPADAHVGGDTLLVLGIMKYDFLTQGDARPYVTLGAGIHHTRELIDARPAPGFVWADTGTDERRRILDDSATGAAGTIRLGVDFRMFDPSMFSFEAGWTMLSGATYHANATGQGLGVDSFSGPIHILTVVGRWGWRF